MSVDFGNSMKEFDFICFSETKCNDADKNNMKENMESFGFEIDLKNRGKLSRFKSGGILIVIKKDCWDILRHVESDG